jgi:hypothetical protein
MNSTIDLRPRGDRHWGAKLTDASVIEIRRLYFEERHTMAELAKAHSVSLKTISNVLHGITWKHVPGGTG